MRSAAFVVLGALAGVGPAWADCDHLKWSVAKDREAFATAKPAPADGAEIGVGYVVALTPDAALPYPPGRPPEKGANAAALAVPKLTAGLYQVTISDEGWIDLVQDGKTVKTADFTGQHDCPGVRKSVRFDLQAGAATLEISNAPETSVKVVIAPAP